MFSAFGTHIDAPVERFGVPQLYRMRSVDADASFSGQDISDIVRICNEPLLWRFLFRDRLGGRRYEEQDALAFLDWARAGWISGEHMVFLLRDPRGRLGACIDIGALDESREALIGYWAGAHHRGVMTNTVEALAGLAKGVGYLKLVALVEPENVRSSAVLQRAGFSHLGFQEQSITFLDRPLGTTLRFLRYERAL